MRNLRTAISALMEEASGNRRLLSVVYRTVSFIMLMSMMAMATGCRQKELLIPECEMCTIDVRFLWDNARGAEPEGMTLLFYPRDARGNFWRYDIAGKDGGKVEIAPGSYTMIALNNDLPGVSLEDISYIDSASAVADHTGQEQIESAGMLYEGVIDRLTVTSDEVSYYRNDSPTSGGRDTMIECYPDSVTTIFRFRLTEAKGLEYIRGLDCMLEGCACGILLFPRRPREDSVAVAFRMHIDPDGDAAEGVVAGFRQRRESADYTLALRAHYYNGGTFEKKIDVTQEILNYPYPHNVEIIINGLIFPDNPSQDEGNHGSLGIDVGVDGWHLVEIDINNTN